MGFKGGDRGSRLLRALMPFTLEAGLMKPRKEFTPVTGKEKTGSGQDVFSLTKIGYNVED
jgi:hypothetical protein